MEQPWDVHSAAAVYHVKHGSNLVVLVDDTSDGLPYRASGGLCCVNGE